MSSSLIASPIIAAIELLRVNIDSMQLEELLEHHQAALNVQADLNDYMNQPARRSADERRTVARLSKKMLLHMAHLRDLINARKAALALTQAAQVGGAGDAEQGSRPHRP